MKGAVHTNIPLLVRPLPSHPPLYIFVLMLFIFCISGLHSDNGRLAWSNMALG